MAKRKAPPPIGETFLAAAAGDIDAIRRVVGGRVLKTLREVADCFGVSQDTVKTGWRGAGMPGSNGHYDLAAVLHWKLARREQSPQTAGENPARAAKQLADARRAAAEAEKSERENREAAGHLVERSAIEQAMAEAIVAARENFRRLPRAIMPLLPKQIAQDIHDELASRIDAVLIQLAEWQPPERESDDPPQP